MILLIPIHDVHAKTGLEQGLDAQHVHEQANISVGECGAKCVGEALMVEAFVLSKNNQDEVLTVCFSLPKPPWSCLVSVWLYNICAHLYHPP